MEWQPIKSAPKSAYTPILVCQSRNGIIRTAVWSVRYTHWSCGHGPMGFIAEVTHWMPLPDPPAEDNTQCTT